MQFQKEYLLKDLFFTYYCDCKGITFITRKDLYNDQSNIFLRLKMQIYIAIDNEIKILSDINPFFQQVEKLWKPWLKLNKTKLKKIRLKKELKNLELLLDAKNCIK